VIAEVWDARRPAWRMVEPQFDQHDDVDVLDVPRDPTSVSPPRHDPERITLRTA
jgi:hypothetical protein